MAVKGEADGRLQPPVQLGNQLARIEAGLQA